MAMVMPARSWLPPCMMPAERQRILHVITGLGLGGAETMLFKLLKASDRNATEHAVLTLTSVDLLAEEIRKLGVSVRSLGITGGVSGIRALWRARAVVREFKPQLVMTWLHHADLFGTALKGLLPSMRLAWNLRCSKLAPNELSANNIRIVRLLAKLSFVPDVVVANARAGKTEHIAVGYSPRRWRVLPNGFDTQAFAPDAAARARVRASLGLSAQHFVIGMVGRYHAMKGFGLFVEAAGKLARENDQIRFVLVGKDVDAGNEELRSLLVATGVEDRVLLLGQRSDVAPVMNALDVLANTSTSEGFPNVIGEAMACGVPCVATDVGDSADIIGDAGIVTPSGDVAALVAAWRRLSMMPGDEFAVLKAKARQRVIEEYEIGVVARRYQELFDEFA